MIKVKVAELMEERGWNISDLMHKMNVAYTTAFRLAKGKGESISFEILGNLCEIFEVEVQDILEYVPDKKR